MQRPTDPRTKSPITPAHEFEVHLEADDYTEEKYNKPSVSRNIALTEIQVPGIRELSAPCTQRETDGNFKVWFQTFPLLWNGANRPSLRWQEAKAWFLPSMLSLGWATGSHGRAGPSAWLRQLRLPHVSPPTIHPWLSPENVCLKATFLQLPPERQGMVLWQAERNA